ncbi:unnamed protein product, partial [Polarella glacialis]
HQGRNSFLCCGIRGRTQPVRQFNMFTSTNGISHQHCWTSLASATSGFQSPRDASPFPMQRDASPFPMHSDKATRQPSVRTRSPSLEDQATAAPQSPRPTIRRESRSPPPAPRPRACKLWPALRQRSLELLLQVLQDEPSAAVLPLLDVHGWESASVKAARFGCGPDIMSLLADFGCPAEPESQPQTPEAVTPEAVTPEAADWQWILPTAPPPPELSAKLQWLELLSFPPPPPL